jgi:hypothetical protein
MTLKHEPDISAYEKSHPLKAVMYEPVDFKHFAAPNSPAVDTKVISFAVTEDLTPRLHVSRY